MAPHRPCLLKDMEAPEYLREDSIRTGYRCNLSYKACVFSWFWLHNETVNIWSHFLGFLFFFYFMAFMMFWPPQEVKSHLELLPLIIQLVSYQVCMLSSALFHTFSCHSEYAHDIWQETDHLGILCALFGTYISLLSVTFTCFPVTQTFHMALVVLMFASVLMGRYRCKLRASAMFFNPDSPKIPLSIFLMISLYAVVPLTHWAWLHGGFFNVVVQQKIRQIVVPFVIGAIGLSFYVTRFPEKVCRTGWVDIVGSSHQVWHVMIFLGMAVWYQQTWSSFIIDRNQPTCLDIGPPAPDMAPSGDTLQALIRLVWLEELLYTFDAFFR